MPDACTSAARPTSSACPSTTPSTPSPSRFTNSSAAGSCPTSLRAASAIARPIGCSDASSIAPTRRRSSARSTPSASVTSTRPMRPLVTVPVLSSTTVSMRPVDSSTSGPLIRIPSCAPRPVPTSSAVGVARPRAHGQATIRTATAAVSAKLALAPVASHPTSVTSESATTSGTNTPDDPVGEPLHLGLARLGLGHEAPDLGEGRVGADLARTDHEASAGVRRRPDDLVAGVLLDRHRLAGQERLVDRGRALLDDPVGRDLLTRTRDEAIADGQLGDRDAVLAPARIEHGHVLRAELEQRAQRGIPSAVAHGPRSSGRPG